MLGARCSVRVAVAKILAVHGDEAVGVRCAQLAVHRLDRRAVYLALLLVGGPAACRCMAVNGADADLRAVAYDFETQLARLETGSFQRAVPSAS